MSFDFAKLPYRFSEERMLEDLKICQASVFSSHYNSADYSGGWKLVALRSMDGDPQNIRGFSLTGEFEDTPLLDSCSYFKEVIDGFQCEKESVRLLNLMAGSKIHEHSDHNLGYEDGVFRIHIPISTNNKVLFYINNTVVTMNVGDCWYGNFNLPHKVENKGDTDRVHLVIDCIRNSWSDDMFAGLGYDFQKETEEPELSEETKLLIIEQLKLLNTEAADDLIEKYSATLNKPPKK